MQHKAETGFTLLELLLVMAIIGILATLLLAAINGAIGKARRVACTGNLRQISLGVRMYADDSNDKAPKLAASLSNPYSAYKELMKSYVAMRGKSSAQDKLFACPADRFYFDYLFRRTNMVGYVAESLCSQPEMEYSSYSFNGGNAFASANGSGFRPGISGLPLSSIKLPARTVLVAETPALVPFSWHKPKHPLYWLETRNCPNFMFNGALDMVSFVDGHVSYTKMHWNGVRGSAGASCSYDPPADYNYQWSGN